MEQIKEFADRYLTQIQFIGPMDIVEIILISLMVYYLLIFIRNTRAWQLLKGVFVILVFLVIAEILQMDTILWIAAAFVVMSALTVIFISALKQLWITDFLCFGKIRPRRKKGTSYITEKQ